MAEPKHAYIACTDSPEKVKENGFVHISHGVTLYLDPTEAIDEEKRFVGLRYHDEETLPIYLYQVDLTQLEGVWPRVAYETYNDFQLKWKCNYVGKLPVAALSHLNTVATKLEPQLARP